MVVFTEVLLMQKHLKFHNLEEKVVILLDFADKIDVPGV